MQRRHRSMMGMALAEVMIAAAILGGITLAVMKMNESAQKGAKGVEQNNEFTQLYGQIVRVLSDNVHCLETFNGVNISTVGSMTNGIKKGGSTPSVLLDTTTNKSWPKGGKAMWQVSGITHAAFVPSTSASLGTVEITINYDRVGTNIPGATKKSMVVPVYGNKSGNAFTYCLAASSSKSDGSVWIKSVGTTPYIYYTDSGGVSGGFVGIGTTSAPTEKLQVNNGNIAVTGGNVGVDAGYGLKVGGSLVLTTGGTNSKGISLGNGTASGTGESNYKLGWDIGSLTGDYNIAIGDTALGSTTSGNNNVAMGILALSRNSTSSDNTAIGHMPLRNLTSGSTNTAIGSGSAFNVTSGSNSTYLGAAAGPTTGSSSSRSVFIGYAAGSSQTGTVDDQLFIARSGGTPLVWGDFANYRLSIGTIATSNLGGSNYANLLVSGNIKATGCIYSSTTAVGGSVACVSVSDRKFKVNVERLFFDNLLERLERVEYVSYNFKRGDTYHSEKDWGVIAQDLKAVFPEFVKVEKDGSHAVSYSKLDYAFRMGVQELIRRDLEKDERIQQLTLRNDLLEADVQDLKARLERLEKRLETDSSH